MLPVSELQLGYRDAENYKRRENKDLFNKVFVPTSALARLCEPGTFFLIGEKGAGKTAYAIYLENNSNYQNISASLRYIRETDYAKFVQLKRDRHLNLSDYTNIWKVIIYLLLAEMISSGGDRAGWPKSLKFRNLKTAMDHYYKNAFAPEIINAMQFAEESDVAAQLLAKYASVGATHKETSTFTKSQFQTNLFYIQHQFEDALRSVKLERNHVLFIDGIDIRPGVIPYEEYSECIKGLANAVWGANNDYFSKIKDSKGRLRVVLLLRPDIFASLGLQNQNSKLQDNSAALNWVTTYTEHRTSPLFQMACRLLAFQQSEQRTQEETWDYYFPFDAPDVTSAQAKPSSFISFLRYSLYRPRDILAILTILKENFIEQRRPANDVFRASDFTDPVFTRKYSDYLLGEVKDHLSFYYPATDWEKFLKFFQCFNGQWSFTYTEYIAAYQEFIDFLKRNSETTPAFAATPDAFLQFLFDLGVLCYIAETGDERFFGWCFRERTAINIAPRVRTGVRYEIHFGLRKALDLGRKFERPH